MWGVSASRAVHDCAKKVYYSVISLSNPTANTIAGPVKVELHNLTTGVTLANASGTHNGTPFVRAKTALAPGAIVLVKVVFSNPAKTATNYTVKT